MVIYGVYRASFKTEEGTTRWYLGYTGFRDRRRRQLQQKGGEFQPAYLKAGCDDFVFQIISDGMTSKGVARAVEALKTAQHWKTCRNTRGGPWLRPTLLDTELTELRAAARCETLADLFNVASNYPSGKLNAHLRNLDYKDQGSPSVSSGLIKAVLKRTSQASSSSVVLKQPSQAPPRFVKPRPAAAKPRGVPSDWRYVVVKRKGAKWSGHTQRLSLGVHYGGNKYAQHKWGKNRRETQNKHQRTHRAKKAAAALEKAMKATKAMKAKKA